MTASKCPKCGGTVRPIVGSDRTVRGGTWYEVYCRNCGYRADAFKPRRTKRQK